MEGILRQFKLESTVSDLACGSYPANMLAVTVRPTHKGAHCERVRPLTAPMHTTMVRIRVIITSARVTFPRSPVTAVVLKAPPRVVVYSVDGYIV